MIEKGIILLDRKHDRYIEVLSIKNSTLCAYCNVIEVLPSGDYAEYKQWFTIQHLNGFERR